MRTRAIASAPGLVFLFAANATFAVGLNPRGLGQALIYPYYTVNKSQDTLVSVVNTTGVGKAVEVRFREGYNGRETLAFTLFLSKYDVWTAAVTQIADDGGAILRTGDTSCTLPTIHGDGASFLSSGYDGGGALGADSGPHDLLRTREGFLEIIAGGDIVPGSATDTAITHVVPEGGSVGTPPGCATLDAATFPADLVAPTSGLFGSATIVNVGVGTLFAYNAEALQGFTDTVLYSTSNADGPTLTDAHSSEVPGGGALATVFDANGRPFELDYARGIDAVSATLMANAIYNDYVVDPSLGASTDWILTFPTKQFYVDGAYGDGPLAPFAEAFTNGASNVAVNGTSYDREESSIALSGCTLCPPVGTSVPLAYEVNVMPVQNPIVPVVEDVFGSSLISLYIPPNGADGHAVLDLASEDGGHVLTGGVDAGGNAVALAGLPIAGFMAYNVINAQAQPGMLANYSGTFRHRSSTSCLGPADECPSAITGGGQ